MFLQHSSKTRFISQYKKMSVTDSLPSDDDDISDDASIRVIDPSRARDTEEVVGLGIVKKPVKRVKINEGANQVMKTIDSETIASFEEPQGDLSLQERFITFDIAISLINKDVSNKTDEILKQMKRIEFYQEEITQYKQDLINMQKQFDIYRYSLTSIKLDHLPDMNSHQFNAQKNTEKMKETKRKNIALKGRFDKYRKAMSLETRLIELEKKIKQAWKRDEIWVGIRDWGLLSILLFFLVITVVLLPI
ncbi:hypothetical protein BDF21DRAFT_253549 [Thamnidium elegans]|nr:hypothetical protein BDF21DRAFT_253549 [Thamnidium elegans]